MSIDIKPLDSGGILNVSEKKPPKPAPVNTGKTSDTVEISGGMGRKEIVDISTSVPIEFPVREDMIEAVARRVSSRTYETPEVREKVAEQLIESPALSGTVYEAAGDRPATVRSEKVESAQTKAVSGYYDRPEVLNAAAEKLIDALGLSSLFGK